MASGWLARVDLVMPGLGAARRYERAWLRWDVLAGITVAAYLVPQVMAYGTLAGLNPVTGLWAAIPSLTLYALVGSSRQLSVGPESAVALMAAVVIAPLAAGQPDRYAALAGALAVLVGLLAVAGWVLRLGFVADLLSAPILVGYLAGVAVLMIVGQLGKGSVLERLATFGEFTKVNLGDARFGFVETRSLRDGAGGGVKVLFEPVLSHSPPLLEVAPATLATRENKVRLTGRAVDSDRVQDVFVFVGPRKVFYQSNRKASDAKKR